MAVKKIQPPFLREGDEIAIISPSSFIDDKILYEASVYLEKWGLRVRIGRNAAGKDGPFSGSDIERLSDLQEVTDDRSIKAVFCSRGGYGLSRIISRVDFSVLKEAPKWYVGFSDITVLHSWLNEVCGVISIHGEMPLNFNNPKKTLLSFSTLKNALFGESVSIEWVGDFYKSANVYGEMTGGNLSLLSTLSGTKAGLTTTGKILFIEEVGEYYYHIDRMLTSMKISGKLEGLSALVIGGMSRLEDARIPWGKSIEETVLEIVAGYNYPVLFNFPAGHIADNRAFYIGKKARIEISGSTAVLLYE